jgi:hypothetical protein
MVLMVRTSILLYQHPVCCSVRDSRCWTRTLRGNQVWTLVEPPRDVNVIGTKWVFKNKQGEDGEVVRNKAHLIAQGYNQVEGQDFGETFASMARLEAIRILLSFAASKGFKLYQMDVESVFLNGAI